MPAGGSPPAVFFDGTGPSKGCLIDGLAARPLNTQWHGNTPVTPDGFSQGLGQGVRKSPRLRGVDLKPIRIGYAPTVQKHFQFGNDRTVVDGV